MMALIPRLTVVVAICSTIATAQPAAKRDVLARGQAAAKGAVDYLTSKQRPDGAWHSDQAPPAISAIVLKAIVQDERYDAGADSVRKGYDKLLSYQYENGGIYRDLLANYNTAIAVSSLAAAENPEFQGRIDKAVAYLKALQWNDTIAAGPKGEKSIEVGNPWFGGFGYGSRGRPDGSNTQIALEALHDAGVSKEDPAMQAALKFVSRMQNLSETNDQKWAGNDGGGVYTPANNGESFAGEYTGEDGRRMLRSYGSMTYAMLKSYIYAGLSKDDPRVKAAWDWISNNWSVDENPGMRFSSPDHAQYGLFYYYMTLARALNVYDQPVIVDRRGNRHDWRVELIDKLTELQAADGSFTGDKRWMEDNPVLATAYAAIALQEALEDLKQHPSKTVD